MLDFPRHHQNAGLDLSPELWYFSFANHPDSPGCRRAFLLLSGLLPLIILLLPNSDTTTAQRLLLCWPASAPYRTDCDPPAVSIFTFTVPSRLNTTVRMCFGNIIALPFGSVKFFPKIFLRRQCYVFLSAPSGTKKISKFNTKTSLRRSFNVYAGVSAI